MIDAVTYWLCYESPDAIMLTGVFTVCTLYALCLGAYHAFVSTASLRRNGPMRVVWLNDDCTRAEIRKGILLRKTAVIYWVKYEGWMYEGTRQKVMSPTDKWLLDKEEKHRQRRHWRIKPLLDLDFFTPSTPEEDAL